LVVNVFVDSRAFLKFGLAAFRQACMIGGEKLCSLVPPAGKLLRHGAQFLRHATRKAADAHLEPLQIVDGADFLSASTAHLAAGIARQKRGGVVALAAKPLGLPLAGLGHLR
jgi:hypothetical protein